MYDLYLKENSLEMTDARVAFVRHKALHWLIQEMYWKKMLLIWLMQDIHLMVLSLFIIDMI